MTALVIVVLIIMGVEGTSDYIEAKSSMEPRNHVIYEGVHTFTPKYDNLMRNLRDPGDINDLPSTISFSIECTAGAKATVIGKDNYARMYSYFDPYGRVLMNDMIRVYSEDVCQSYLDMDKEYHRKIQRNEVSL